MHRPPASDDVFVGRPTTQGVSTTNLRNPALQPRALIKTCSEQHFFPQVRSTSSSKCAAPVPPLRGGGQGGAGTSLDVTPTFGLKHLAKRDVWRVEWGDHRASRYPPNLPLTPWQPVRRSDRRRATMCLWGVPRRPAHHCVPACGITRDILPDAAGFFRDG